MDEQIAMSTALHPPNVWEQFADGAYFILKHMHLEIFFHHINNLYQNINFTIEEESNGELAFPDTLLKLNNGKISVLIYRMRAYTDQYLYYSSHHQTSCKKSVVSSLFNRPYSITTNKDGLTKEYAKIKQVLKRIFPRINNNHSLTQSQQQTQTTDTQEEEIRMSIDLWCAEGTSEKL